MTGGVALQVHLTSLPGDTGHACRERCLGPRVVADDEVDTVQAPVMTMADDKKNKKGAGRQPFCCQQNK